MRRFSQRTALVTLADINITPLLDLAFVLLIIFIITTPLLEQGISLKLPTGGIIDAPREVKDIRTVDVSTTGLYVLSSKTLAPMSLDAVFALLKEEKRKNPNLLVYIRADEEGRYKPIAALLNRLEGAGFDRVSLRTAPPTR